MFQEVYGMSEDSAGMLQWLPSKLRRMEGHTYADGLRIRFWVPTTTPSERQFKEYAVLEAGEALDVLQVAGLAARYSRDIGGQPFRARLLPLSTSKEIHRFWFPDAPPAPPGVALAATAAAAPVVAPGDTVGRIMAFLDTHPKEVELLGLAVADLCAAAAERLRGTPSAPVASVAGAAPQVNINFDASFLDALRVQAAAAVEPVPEAAPAVQGTGVTLPELALSPAADSAPSPVSPPALVASEPDIQTGTETPATEPEPATQGVAA